MGEESLVLLETGVNSKGGKYDQGLTNRKA